MGTAIARLVPHRQTEKRFWKAFLYWFHMDFFGKRYLAALPDLLVQLVLYWFHMDFLGNAAILAASFANGKSAFPENLT